VTNVESGIEPSAPAGGRVSGLTDEAVSRLGELTWAALGELDPGVHLRRLKRIAGRRSAREELRAAVSGRRVLITGASTGIGREVAVRVARAGGEVLLVARRPELLDEVVTEIEAAGGRAHAYPADLSDDEQVATLVATVVAEHGAVDILVNNAGRSIRRPIDESVDRLHDFERVMRVNYLGMVRLTLPLVDLMRRTGGGHVVNISTTGTEFGVQPRFAAYLGSKGAMDSFTRSVAAETRADNVKWTTVHMPLVRTAMIAPTESYRRAPAMSPAQGAEMVLDAIRRAPARVSHPIGVVGKVVDTFAPRVLEALRGSGFDPTEPAPLPSVAIIGAGVSGIAMALALQDAGATDFVIYEKADQIGGTWRENTYTGLTCDIPSHYYAYRGLPNPDWSHLFAPGPEIQTYLRRTVEQRQLTPHIRFGSEIVDGRFGDGCWQLRTADGQTHTADVLVCATGVLHHPHIPALPGIENFSGPCFHSARWDHDASVEGARVGVIGSGSSGVQITSALAEVAQSVTLFQRTPHWVATVPNPEMPTAIRNALHHLPFGAETFYEAFRGAFEELAKATTQDGWQRAAMAWIANRSLATIGDEDLRTRLTPEYQPGCKRLIFSPDFYEAVQRDDVEVVTEKIIRIQPGGVETADGRVHELDVLVLATGFESHAYIRPMSLTGRDGVALDDAWRNGPAAYLSTAVPGFPNMFMMLGPNSPLGNTSLVRIAETQAQYVVAWLRRMRERNLGEIEVTAAAAGSFRREVEAAMPQTLWATGCDSWYLNADGTPILWPWTMGRFERALAELNPDDFYERGRSAGVSQRRGTSGAS
jgi:cation diffusion facilitator CzcD-associated flavoprotein CzcO/NAD(P)-dependent dehydrogenase (short-subunit alcohol dehydrogenase family)